ncbi:unnamed protein product [Leuciscus chuanchicus]
MVITSTAVHYTGLEVLSFLVLIGVLEHTFIPDQVTSEVYGEWSKKDGCGLSRYGT